MLGGTNSRKTISSKMEYTLSQFSDDYRIKRKNAAQIVHAFLKFECNIPDITDEEMIKKAHKIKDLYDCRVCASSIIQVTVRDLMPPKYILDVNSGHSEQTVIFGTEDEFTEEEALSLRESLSRLELPHSGLQAPEAAV